MPISKKNYDILYILGINDQISSTKPQPHIFLYIFQLRSSLSFNLFQSFIKLLNEFF